MPGPGSTWNWVHRLTPIFGGEAQAQSLLKSSWKVLPWTQGMLLCSAAQSCLTLCSSVNWGRPGSSVHAINQARIGEWAISFSKRSSWPWDQTCDSCIDRQILYHWATWEGPVNIGYRITILIETNLFFSGLIAILADQISLNSCFRWTT